MMLILKEEVLSSLQTTIEEKNKQKIQELQAKASKFKTLQTEQEKLRFTLSKIEREENYREAYRIILTSNDTIKITKLVHEVESIS